MTLPLHGIRIVDLTQGWAGPLATRNLADMGADVIKVEGCERFDWWRSWEATPAWIADDGAEKSTQFNMVNRHKRSLTLDLEDTRGKGLLLDLIATANAVVENFSAGVMPKLGLGYEALRAVNPNIILLSMPAFGTTGPWRTFRAYGSTVEHSSGLPHLHGHEDDPPTMVHVAYGDPVGGINGSAALLTALRYQARTGEGQFVDLSQVEALFPLGVHGILEYSVTGQAPRREGNRSRRFAPHGVFPCLNGANGSDEWIVIQVFDEGQWQRLCDVHPALGAFGGLDDRLRRVEELEDALAAWTRTQSAHALMLRLQALGIPAAATHDAQTLLEDAHLLARGYWQWKERAHVGSQPNPSAPFREAELPLPIEAVAPTMGQHNREILCGLLGVTEHEFAELENRGIIGTRPRLPRRDTS